MAYGDSPVESTADYLLFAFTDTDISKQSDFKAWASNIDAIVGGGTSWDSRFFADPDQRPGIVNEPVWKYFAPFGLRGDEATIRRALIALHEASAEDRLDAVVWAYEPVGPFIHKRDAVPGSHGDKAPLRSANPPTEDLKHVFMALTDALEGREDDFNDWYNTEHVPDVVFVEPFLSGRRFKLVGGVGPRRWGYLSMYRLIGDVPAAHQSLTDNHDAGNGTMTDAIHHDHGAWIFTLIED